MMKYLYALRCDLNKTVVNIGFAGAALLTAVLCFTAPVYYDNSLDKNYSVLEALFSLDRCLRESEPAFASVRIISAGMSGYITMFLPITVAFPFMVSFCAERNSGLIRTAAARTGEIRYCLSKFTASFLSGGLAAALGLILFGIIVLFAFPSVGSYKLTEEQLSELIPHSPAVTVLLSIAAAFVYGALTTLPAFFLASFCRDPYIITCVPFLLCYIWKTVLEKLAANAMESGKFELTGNYYAFYPEAVTRVIIDPEHTKSIPITLCFNIGLLLFTAIGAVCIFTRRQDKGR